MKILLIGSGGREFALAWKMGCSSIVERIIVLPGNDAMERLSKVSCRSGDPNNIEYIVNIVKQNKIDLVVVGPEEFLKLGISDKLRKEGVLVFGPSAESAQIESSKIFAKTFMYDNDIPTCKSIFCDSYDAARTIVKNWDFSKEIVIKVDGLAAGKGVVVTNNKETAYKALFDFMKNKDCRVKTDKILIEKKLSGKEVSAFAICDGKDFINLGYVCDYKRAKDFDKGPNTGGMGCYTPKNWPSDSVKKVINEQIFQKVINGMNNNGYPYKGILYAGLMIGVNNEVNVIEFNSRFGDPETQTLLPLIDEDLVPILKSASEGNLWKIRRDNDVALKNKVAVHVTMASKGYPSIDGYPLATGENITYPENLDKKSGIIFFAGVKKNTNGKFINTGGRVLGVTSLGSTIESAMTKVYEIISKISFRGAHWRTDIGK
jgi:phosphoribosylamine---glycine ligase